MADKSANNATLRWRRLENVLKQGWVFRWETLSLYVLIGIPFSSTSEYARLASPNLLSALGVSTIAVGMTVVLIQIAGWTRHLVSNAPTWLILIGLSGIGATRGWLTTLIVDATGVNRQSYLDTRILISAVAVPVLVVISASIVATISLGRRERAMTKRQIAQLRNERDDILGEIASGDELLLRESERTLRPRIDAILHKLQTPSSVSRTALADSLDDLISSVVRPLSHALAARARTHGATTESVSIPTDAPVFPTADTFIGPALTAAGVYLTTVVIFFDIVPLFDGLTTALIGAAITWAILRTFQALLSGLTLTVTFILTIVFLAHLGTALLVSWIDVTMFRELGIGLEITIALSAATLVPGLLFVAQRLVAHLSAVRLSELSTVRRDMSIEASEVRRRAWLRQRHIAHALHSAIQSRLNAEARLVRMGSGNVTPADATRVASSLGEIFEVLRNTDGAPADSLGELRRAVEFWEGMCHIDCVVEDGVADMLGPGTDIGETVLVTCLELINNSIRHGKSTELRLTLERVSFDLIRVRGINNGTPLGDYTPGLGMSMFDELAVHWSVTSADTETIFTAFIAARNPVDAGSSVN